MTKMSAIDRLKRRYWRLRVIVRHPTSELILPAKRTLIRFGKMLRTRVTGLWNRRSLRKAGIKSFPPAQLRFRVHGDTDLDGFINTGKKCSHDIISAARRCGREFGTFRSILDFGCGCGRTLVWFADYINSAEFHGTDIDAEAISWCQANYSFGNFDVNNSLPPLEYPSKTFDMIYAISVLTHISEEHQFQWLGELKRISRDDGILLLSVHGEHSWKELPSVVVDQLTRSGILFVSNDYWKGMFPDWYQTTYHTRQYVMDNFSKYFRIVNYIPQGINHHQDLVVLQNEG